MLGKAKSKLQGYSRARPFGTQEIARCVDYDIKVVDEWIGVLADYTGSGEDSVRGARILELGPGADLGAALYLLSKGAGRYCTVDAYPLALQASAEIHEAMVAEIARRGSAISVGELRQALASAQNRKIDESAIRYVVRPDFEFADAFGRESFDLVFSQAAFEHFDDVEHVIRQVTQVTRPGGRLIAGVDLQTHARWLREKDPLNIYRFSEHTYRLLGFRSMPNRVRPSDYERILRKYNWERIEFRNVASVDEAYFERVRSALDPAFRSDETKQLWIVVCATRT